METSAHADLQADKAATSGQISSTTERGKKSAVPSEEDALQAVLSLKEHDNLDLREISAQFATYSAELTRYETALLMYSTALLVIGAIVFSQTAFWPLSRYMRLTGIHFPNDDTSRIIGLAAILLALAVVYFVGFLLIVKPALREVQFRASKLNTKVDELGGKLSERLNAKDASAIASVALDFGRTISIFERIRRFVLIFEPVRFCIEFIFLLLIAIATTAALIMHSLATLGASLASIACWLVFLAFIVVEFLSSQPKRISEKHADAEIGQNSDDSASRKRIRSQLLSGRRSAIELGRLDGVVARLTFETAVCLYYLRSTAPMIPAGMPVIMGKAAGSLVSAHS